MSSRIVCALLVAATLGAVACAVPQGSTAAEDAPPLRLVLQITVDQLRADLLTRHADRYGQGGLRQLLDRGLLYANAHYEHANTETIVGHATLATGAHPADHGMIGNVWFDREQGRLVYNIEDERYRLVTTGAGVDATTEIDPTQKAAKVEGRSPDAIRVSTFGDELAIATRGRAKVFGVSVKDRGAVSMAGHAGTAYWFSKAAGEFVTSTYYMDAYPDWVVDWNAERRPFRYADTAWELLAEPAGYCFAEADDQPWETNLPGFGRTFPHSYGKADGRFFTTFLTTSPAGDALTVEFAKTLISHESIGDDDVLDFLGVSLSSTDYVGHLFGPASLEMEDNLLRLDRAIADLLAFVDAEIGLDRTVVVLSADHGGPDAPGYLETLGIESAYVEPESWNKEPGIAALKRKFGVGRELILEYFHPYVYLDREEIRRRDLNLAEVAAEVAEEVLQLDGVAAAVSSTALARGEFPENALHQSILNNFDPKRSGDIFVVFEPQRFIRDFDGLEVAVTHGSPWRYDTHVPILFAGPGIAPGRVHRPVRPNDIAATLSAIAGTRMPSGSEGEPLTEVVEGRH
jgi:predicted AlkP superfamily pyrophosphatase or phosphodiesterase